ncbi:MAG: hypothetical protein EXR67_00180 [Dehalococcoidia bacterium]|nr:hypothetical protein [Dehalococcoidia bacterium]
MATYDTEATNGESEDRALALVPFAGDPDNAANDGSTDDEHEDGLIEIHHRSMVAAAADGRKQTILFTVFIAICLKA